MMREADRRTSRRVDKQTGDGSLSAVRQRTVPCLTAPHPQFRSRPTAPSGRELSPPQAETEGDQRQVRYCFAPIIMRTENRYGNLPPLKGLGGFAAVAVSFADSSLPEGAIGALNFDKMCSVRTLTPFISVYHGVRQGRVRACGVNDCPEWRRRSPLPRLPPRRGRRAGRCRGRACRGRQGSFPSWCAGRRSAGALRSTGWA